MNRLTGWTIVAVAAGAVVGIGTNHAWRQGIPASAWLDVRSVTASDATEGDDVTLVVERSIRAGFHGEWIVTVRRLEHGGFSTYCTGTGENLYIPGDLLPRPLYLSRWMGKACPLPPGQYRVDTRWLVNADGYSPKAISIESNLFRVSPRQ